MAAGETVGDADDLALGLGQRLDVLGRDRTGQCATVVDDLLAIVVIAVAAVFMLLVFAYYMYRTGNSTTTSARELAFRNFLENTLIARPRTKEMIVGWPMLMLFIWSLRRRMKFLPMIFGIALLYGVGKLLHLAPLVMVLLVGLLLGSQRISVIEDALAPDAVGSWLLVVLQLLYLPNLLAWLERWAVGNGEWGMGSR